MVAPREDMRGCSQVGHAWLLLGGVHGCSQGGMHGCSQGGMHGCSRGCAWLLRGGVVAPGGACVVAGGGHARDTTRYGDTVNERAVRILLECILVV